MEEIKDIVKKYDKPVTRTRYAYKEEKGKMVRTEKQITLNNCYVLIKENGDSFVGTADEFKKLGIKLPYEPTQNNTTNPPQV